jgi:hypothetical protein
MKDGRKYFWCGKQECSNWNTTHSTASHVERGSANAAEVETPAEATTATGKSITFSQSIAGAVKRVRKKSE